VAAIEFLPVIAIAALGTRTARNGVALVLAVAGVVAGIAGAVVAVPVTAAVTSATRALREDDEGG